jgi:NADPH:quinone reductase-like Zn-dependent oxidoreductase/acyl carrier protein
VAGWVTRVGADVDTLAIGDAVAALAIGGFSDYVVTAADLTLKMPSGWSFAEFVSIPAAFATAYHALIQLGRVRPGQKVLIHAATGAVGLTAVQLAQREGCEIIATAGSEAKRDYLRSIGVKHVFDSRSLSFASGIRALLGPDGGIDVIVNTVSGAFIEASLRLLSPSGRFIELGKRDIWDAARVASIRPQAAYFVVDLAAQTQRAPAEFQLIWSAASAAIEAQTLRPLPLQVFARDEVQAAFRYMAQARHIGKIVVACSSANASNDRDTEPNTRFYARPDASYLITGGLGGLGLHTAQWLIARGARHLALMGRSEPDDAARAILETFRAAGVQVLVCNADVAERAEVARVLESIANTLPALRGIIHSAGVLDDGALLQQNWARFERVLAPKVAGALNLHCLTRDLPLDFFVCYSSASAILGSRGQSNHAAANAWLDALAHHRRGLGLAGLSINWGAWSGIGAAARPDVFDRVAQFGVSAITPDEGLAALERLMLDQAVQTAVIAMDWPRFLATLPPSERSYFSEVATDTAATPVGRKATRMIDESASSATKFELASAPERRKLIQVTVRDAVVAVLGLESHAQLDPQQSFRDLGFDSLLSIELRNRLQAAMRRPLPATLAFDFPSMSSMVEYFCQQYGEAAAQAEIEPEVAALTRLSAEEAESVLMEELARTRDVLL